MKENASVANSNNWVLRVLPCLELWPAVTVQSEKISHRRYTYWSKSLKHQWVSWFPVIWVSHDLKQVVTDVEKGIYTSLRSHLVGLLQVSNSFVAVHVASLRTWYRLPPSTLLACARTFHFTMRWKWGIPNEKCLLKFVEGRGVHHSVSFKSRCISIIQSWTRRTKHERHQEISRGICTPNFLQYFISPFS